MESIPAAADKTLHDRLSSFSNDELARLALLEPGTRLEQGGVYLDLNHLDDGPFQALGGHEATLGARLIAKRDTDYELWNRLAGQDAEPTIERPDGRSCGSRPRVRARRTRGCQADPNHIPM